MKLKNDNVIEYGNIDEDSKSKLIIDILGSNNRITIGNNVVIKKELEITINGNNSCVNIGDYTTFERTSIGVAEDENYVEIGEDCMFAKDTKIFATDFHSIISIKDGKRLNFKKGVNIGNHVWFGANAIILKGSSVGDNCVLGAGTIVSGKFGDNLLLVGASPCKILKKDISWDRELLTSHPDVSVKNIIADEDNIQYYLERKISNSNSNLAGWVAKKDMQNSDYYLYILCEYKNKKKVLFPARQTGSEDVVQELKNKNLNHCRFYAFINKKDLINVSLVVFYEGKLYSKNITNDYKL